MTRLCVPHAGALSFVLVRHAGASVTGFRAPRRRSETRPCVPRKPLSADFVCHAGTLSLPSYRSAGHTPEHRGQRLGWSHRSAHMSWCRHQANAPRALRVYPRIALPAIRQGITVIDFERRIATARPLSCCSAGGRPRTQAPRVYPRVALPALRLGTRVTDSDHRPCTPRV